MITPIGWYPHNNQSFTGSFFASNHRSIVRSAQTLRAPNTRTTWHPSHSPHHHQIPPRCAGALVWPGDSSYKIWYPNDQQPSGCKNLRVHICCKKKHVFFQQKLVPSVDVPSNCPVLDILCLDPIGCNKLNVTTSPPQMAALCAKGPIVVNVGNPTRAIVPGAQRSPQEVSGSLVKAKGERHLPSGNLT